MLAFNTKFIKNKLLHPPLSLEGSPRPFQRFSANTLRRNKHDGREAGDERPDDEQGGTALGRLGRREACDFEAPVFALTDRVGDAWQRHFGGRCSFWSRFLKQFFKGYTVRRLDVAEVVGGEESMLAKAQFGGIKRLHFLDKACLLECTPFPEFKILDSLT